MIMIPQPQANLHGFAPMSAGSTTNMDSVSVQNGSSAVCTTSHEQDAVRHNGASSNYDMILQQEEVRIAHQLQVLQQARREFHQTRHRRIPANQLAIQTMNQFAGGAECMRPPATITEQEVTHASHPLPTTSLSPTNHTAASNAPPVLPPLDMQPSIQDVSSAPFPSCSNGSHSGSRHMVEQVASATPIPISGRHSSSSSASKTSSSTKKSTPQDFSFLSFQIKLFDMLAQDEAYSKYIAWMPHGRAFKVLVTDKNIIEFEDNVLQKYFRSKKVASFMRQVNGWGFKRINDRNHRDFGAYFHPQFVRDRMDLVHQMKRPGRGEDPLAWVRSDGGLNAMYHNPDFYKLVEQEKKEQAFKNWQQQNVLMQEPSFMPRQQQPAHGLEMVDFQQPLHPPITAPSESLFSLCQRRVSSGDQSLQVPLAGANNQRPSSFFATKAAPMKQGAEDPQPEPQHQQEVLDDFDPQDIEGRGNDDDDDDEVTLSTIGTSIFDDVDDEWSRREEEDRSHYSDTSSLASCELSN